MTTPTPIVPRAAPPGLFCRLPREILQKIIACVAAFGPLEAEDLKEIRYKNVVQLGKLGKTQLLWTYNQPDCPKLNSLQALSAVNKEINKLCCPVLWQALRFPSTLPAPMSTWDGLMDKYGSNVKSLRIELSTDWIAAPPKRAYYLGPRKPIKEKKDCSKMSIIERDNLSTSQLSRVGFPGAPTHKSLLRQDISRENVFRLLHQIPNLNKLYITFESDRGNRDVLDSEHASRLELHLAELITRTNGIRDFSIVTTSTNLPASCIIKAIKLLPNLRSFHCGSVSPSESGSAKDFAIALSELKQLQRLSISCSKVLDSSFQEYYSTAPNILELNLYVCRRFRMKEAPAFISAWTPQLTHLTIRPPLSFNLESSNLDHLQFHLPSLTHLSITQWSISGFLQCFQHCHNIRHLTYLDIDSAAVVKVRDFISLYLPRLKVLITHKTSFHCNMQEREEEIYRKSIIPLSDFCQQKGIIIKINS